MIKRNYGIDLLRCISMMMIVVLHIMGHGKIIAATDPESLNYKVAWFIEIIAYCAVNCYALISGYVGVKTNHKYRNIIPLWLQVAFYTVSIALLFQLFDPASIDLKGIISSFFPVIHSSYWYFTAYFALFFLMPLLNKGINAMTKDDAKKLVLAIIVVFTVIRTILCFNIIGTFGTTDIFITNNGYSVLWLMLLYIVGGCIGKFDFWKTTKAWKICIVFWVSILFSWAFKLHVENPLSEDIKSIVNANSFISYISPTIIATAICLLLLFSRLETLPKTAQKIVTFFAPVSFAVYLIHDNVMVRNMFIKEKFSHLADFNPLEMVLHIFAIVLVIYISCSLIDHIRLLLFKLLHIKEIVNKIADFKIKKKQDVIE